MAILEGAFEIFYCMSSILQDVASVLKYVVHGGWLDFLVTSLLKVHCDNIVQKLKSG